MTYRKGVGETEESRTLQSECENVVKELQTLDAVWYSKLGFAYMVVTNSKSQKFGGLVFPHDQTVYDRGNQEVL